VNIAPRFHHPIDASRRSILTTDYRERFPDAVRTELAEAARLSAHRFTFLGHAMDHGERIAWSRDPVSGREWSRGFSADIPYRGAERLGDIKLPWELSKHQYFFTMGKAAWLSGEVAMAAEIVRQIDHWIADNPCHTGINWISALEAGTRAISWIMAYPFYAEGCDASFRRRLATSLAQHMLFVEQHLSLASFANTHLVGEAAALVAGGLFLDCSHSARWLARGLQILENEIVAQVTSDGVHAERSVAYHRFFLDHYYLVAALLARNGRSLGPATLAGVERMTSFLMYVIFPDGTAPNFGDGDEARGLWMRADAPADYRGLLALGAVLFDRGDFKSAAGSVTEEVLWLQGPEGVAAFGAVSPRLPDETSVAYADAGYYVMRGGWGRSDHVLVFDCGDLGFGPAAHGHADALSFQLHAEGYPFLVDAGTFSYNLDYAWRDVFRGTRAHNTVVVDGQDQSVPKDRLSWTSVAASRPHEWVTTRWVDLVDGEHDGYGRLSDPVAHRRVVLFLKPDVWLICDDIQARQRHELEMLLHVRPDCVVEVAPGTARAVLTSPEGHRLYASTSGEGRLEVMAGSEGERGAWFSPGYGTRVPSRALTFRQACDGSCRLVTCLSASERARPVVTREDGAVWCRITRSEGSDETTVCLADGRRPAEAEGARFDGTLLFHRRITGSPPVVWASRFSELSLDGLLEIRAPGAIDRLSLEDDHCHIVVDDALVSRLGVTTRAGIRLVINGRATAGER
jgi:uncharacterized heparinase superfamily protein